MKNKGIAIVLALATVLVVSGIGALIFTRTIREIRPGAQPRATSRAIIRAKPVMTPKVARSPFPSAWLSGITSSTTTNHLLHHHEDHGPRRHGHEVGKEGHHLGHEEGPEHRAQGLHDGGELPVEPGEARPDPHPP